MCLTIKNTKKPRPKKNGRVNVYKVAKLVRKGLITPFEGIKIKPGWFKADGILSDFSDIIDEGAIHCYPSMKKLYASGILSNGNYRVVLKCEALPSDFIANGKYGDVTYKKIYISKRAIKEALKKGRW